MVRQNANPVGDTAKLSKQFFTKYAAEFDAPPLMAVRTVTGNWSPDVCSTDRMVWLMDVSQTVTEAKDYEVEFKFAKGESGLQLYRVSLMQGARELAADPHPGYSGANPREPIYKLKAGRVTPGQPVLLRCEVSADVSFDSNGEIQVRRAKRVDTRPVGDRAVGGITN